jgi:hypothetical protein
VLRTDESKSSITFQRMTPDFATGPILPQVAYPSVDDDDADSLLQKVVQGFFQGQLKRPVVRAKRAAPEVLMCCLHRVLDIIVTKLSRAVVGDNDSATASPYGWPKG